MNRILKRCLTASSAALVALTAVAFAQSVPRKATPIPAVTGPEPASADSYPFDAAGKLQNPIDLAGRGYVEEEFFVSGTGNIYDWAADGTVTSKAADRPYTTRILVRRPTNKNRFSGTIVVEPAHSGRGFDFNPMWGFIWDYVLSHGDAYVSITITSGNVGALKMFDLKRYSNLSFPRPVPNLCGDDTAPGANGGRGGRGGARGGARGGGEGGDDEAAPLSRPPELFPPSDDYVKWDIISQVGALLKSKSPSNPLAGYNVEVLLATSQTPDDVHTYSRAFHKTAILGNGKPVYDGFLIHEGGGPGAVNGCGGRIAQDDPRRLFRNIGVPVMFVITQNYVPRYYSLWREDSDKSGDQFRQYEIAGVSHLNPWPYLYLPPVKDQAATGTRGSQASWPWDYKCDQDKFSDFPENYLLQAMFDNLDQWVRKGTPPPRAGHITQNNPGTPTASYATDANGNAIGGVRSPFVDVPAATYRDMTGASANCSQTGYKVPFDSVKMDALYGNSRNYQAKFVEAIDRSVRDHWLLKSDAEKLKAEARSQAFK